MPKRTERDYNIKITGNYKLITTKTTHEIPRSRFVRILPFINNRKRSHLR